MSGVIMAGKFAGCNVFDLSRTDLLLTSKDPRSPRADRQIIEGELQRRRRLWRQRVARHKAKRSL
jgi:hypothetical protein